MCIFQSEQVTKLINFPVSLKKNEWPLNSPVQNPLDYNVWGATLGRCQKFTPKPSNIAKLKTALLSIWNDLPQDFIDKAILSFRRSLDLRLLLQLVDILNTTFSLNTERAADIHRWNVWIVDEKMYNVWFVITKYSGRDCLFTWKVKFKVKTVASVEPHLLF